MKIIAIFAVVFAIGLIGSVYAYAQPDAGNWGVAFVIMLVIGAIGFIVALILHLIRLIRRGKDG